jgi:protein-disulfide isomerase
MQKKKLPDTSSSSAWQENIKKQDRSDKAKKYGIWGIIIAVCVVGFAGLAYLTNKTTTSPSIAGKEETNLRKVDDSDIIVGNPKAKITLMEYGDMQCPACAAYNPLVNQVLDDYKGEVRLVYRFFPLTTVHKHAYLSAQAAYAAWKMDKFDDMKNKLFDKQGDWEALSDPDAQNAFVDYAREVGLDQDKFKELMLSKEAKEYVSRSEKEAIGLGLNSTPTFFLGNVFIAPKNLSDFKSLIDQKLSSKQ